MTDQMGMRNSKQHNPESQMLKEQ